MRQFIAREWRHLPYPAPGIYAVSDQGEVCRIGSPNDLRPCTLKRGGYLAVSLWNGNRGKTHPVHQLVAAGFHGPRPSPRHHAAHFDGDKLNNTPLNVRWATKEENEAHKKTHGTDNSGERNGQAKLSAATVMEIKDAAKSGERTRDVAARFGISESHVSSITTGRIWRHL